MVITPNDSQIDLVRSKRFIFQLDQIRDLKQFLFEEQVQIPIGDVDHADLGQLNNLLFGKDGRAPTAAEWRSLDETLALLATHLDLELKRKYRIRRLAFFFGPLPLIALTLSAVLALIYMIYPRLINPDTIPGTAIFITVTILWAISLGTLGACAFLGTTAISTRSVAKTTSVQTSQTESKEFPIDITDRSILKIRIISGSLFAFLLGLPFSYRGLDLIRFAVLGKDTAQVDGTDPVPTIGPENLAIVLLPFVVGFSTNFVLAVLNRMIESLETFFGFSRKAK